MPRKNIPLYSLQDDRSDSDLSDEDTKSPSQIDNGALSPSMNRSTFVNMDPNINNAIGTSTESNLTATTQATVTSGMRKSKKILIAEVEREI